MQAFLREHKWTILAAGAAIQIFTGIPAAWGAFQRYVCGGYDLSENDAGMIFSFVICFFGIGCVLGGLLQDKKGPRTAGVCGTVLLAGGFCAAGFVPGGQPWLFWLCFSVPVGLGCAFLYPAVMSCAQKWYAERKGLATGVIGGAVGASGAVLAFSVQWLCETWNIRVCFFVLAAVMAVVCGVSCIVLENPQDAPAQKKAKLKDYSVQEMLHTKQFWLLTAAVALATPAVLLFSPVIVELAQKRGMPEGAALLCIVVGSVFSAGGRLLMPWLSDKIGRRAADMILFAALAGLSVAFAFAGNWWVLIVYSLLTFCYSGEAAVLPAAVTDLFGQKNTGVNYGFAALGMSAGSIGFPLLARCFSVEWAKHAIAVCAALAGFLCILALKPTQGEKL